MNVKTEVGFNTKGGITLYLAPGEGEIRHGALSGNLVSRERYGHSYVNSGTSALGHPTPQE